MHVHRGSKVIGNTVLPTIETGALVKPTAEYGLNGKAELERGGGGELDLARCIDELGMKQNRDVFTEDRLKLVNELAKVLGGKIAILADSRDQALHGKRVFKQVRVDSENDVGEHLDKPAIGIPCEPRVAGLPDKALNGVVIKAEVENGIHHAGHGKGSSGANRHQQGIVWVAQALSHALFEVASGLIDLVEHALRPFVAAVRIIHAGFACDGETRRNGQPQTRHLGKISPFAPEDKVHTGIALCNIEPICARAKTKHALTSFHTNPLLELRRSSDANRPPSRMGTRRISCMIGRDV